MASALKAGTDMFSAIFDTVAVTARTASNGVSVIGLPINMATVYLTAASERQAIDTITLMANYEDRSLMTAAEEQQVFEETLLRRVHANPVKKAHYEDIHTKLKAKLAARHNPAE